MRVHSTLEKINLSKIKWFFADKTKNNYYEFWKLKDDDNVSVILNGNKIDGFVNYDIGDKQDIFEMVCKQYLWVIRNIECL